MAVNKQTQSVGTKAKTARSTKVGKVIDVLRSSEGATLDEMVKATGWQPHSARAVLTGLKKKGRFIEKTRRDNATCYRITNDA